jgi:hypothetical protein
MDYNQILQVLAPCGLNCKKCMAYNSSNIKHHSIKLKELLGSFDNYVELPFVTNEKGVDNCYQCNEFPCEKSNFDENLKSRWINMNKRMKEIGIEKYYEETNDKPRYL